VSTGKLDREKGTYDKGVILLLTNLKELSELEAPLTRGLPGGVRNNLLIPQCSRTLAGIEGHFCTFVLLSKPT
jgi:hypothetical protein